MVVTETKFRNVYLIQPPRDEGYGSNSRSGCYIPLGLVSIGNNVSANFSDLNVNLLDGELLSMDEINDVLNKNCGPDSVVGIDTKTPNYKSALKIARLVKNLGSRVVIGGVYASAIPELIMRHSSDVIDHVAVGYGEVPFLDILSGRRDGLIVNGTPSFNNLPLLDRGSLVNVEDYILNFQKQHPTWSYRGTNIFTHVGCKYRCLFCERTKPERGVYFRDPNKIWNEVRLLTERHGIDYLVDFSDTITQNHEFLVNLADTKPNDLNPVFHVFSTADGIDNDSINLLKRLNVQHVFVGVESGDEELARSIYKGRNFSPSTSLEAVVKLSTSGIRVTPSFVLGLPGETKESLDRTYEHARRIKEETGFEEIFCSAMIPFPGSIAFKKLRNEMKGDDSFDTDIFDSEELKKLWIERFCEIDYPTIIEYVDKILGLGTYTITIKREA